MEPKNGVDDEAQAKPKIRCNSRSSTNFLNDMSPEPKRRREDDELTVDGTGSEDVDFRSAMHRSPFANIEAVDSVDLPAPERPQTIE